MKQIVIILFFFCFNADAQVEWRLKAYAGKCNLFEAVVAYEVEGSFIGIGVEKRINKFSFFVNFEKFSSQSNHSLGISQSRLEGGEWMLSRYKVHIDLERRDFAFNDIDVNERLFEAGKYNDVGPRQAFNSNNLLIGLGYRIFKYKRLSLWPSIGLAISKINATAINYGYSTELGPGGKRILIRIPAYVSYLYLSGYVNLPITYQITNELEFSLISILYRANNIYLPAVGVSLNVKL